jgi:hypothetical protein
MRRTIVCFLSAALLLLGLGVALAQQKDPIPKRLYKYHCAMFHGDEGDGKGDVEVQMKLELKDWRNPDSLAKMTDGELYCIITNGRGKMTGGEGDGSKETTRWNLVNLVPSKPAQ